MGKLLLFYIFATCLISSACVVIFARNTVYSALALIVAFFNAAALMLIGGAEFLSFVLVIVYVGAVAVLFLFVVMMLNLKENDIRATFGPYLYSALAVGLLLIIEIGIMTYFFEAHPQAADVLVSPRPRRMQNTMALGQILYTHYAYIFQVGGLILFVAMIGAIVLTEGTRRSIPHRKQDISKQNQRTKKNSLVLTSPGLRMGVTPDIIAKHQIKKDDI
ncbi:MAG: NADH-quinone oxidoreductase subunit J [Pseudomonadota bacterium]